MALLLVDNGPMNFITWSLTDELEQVLVDIAEGRRLWLCWDLLWRGTSSPTGISATTSRPSPAAPPGGDPTSGLRVWKLLDTSPFVSIAAVDGQAWGGGAEFAWNCDLRVASHRSTFAQVEVRLGVTAVCAATRLTRLVGESIAKSILLDGRPISAEAAHRFGLVHRMVEPGAAVEEAVNWARWLASHPHGALARTKHSILSVRDVPLKEALDRELDAYIRSLSETEALERARTAQASYDRGSTSAEVFGIESSDGGHPLDR